MITRTSTRTLHRLARGFPIVAITGPRQSGKTTLARQAFPGKPYLSLEDPDILALAESDPRGLLSANPHGAIIDEAQRAPQLFSYLQTRVDEKGAPGDWILTGSQQFGLLSGITQSLAGRVGMLQLLPFSLGELRDAGRMPPTLDELLVQGFYPPLYDRPVASGDWFAAYVTTYVERDVRQLINVRDLSAFQRFVKMCATRTGQLLNLSSLAADCGISHNTAAAWISVLEASYIVHLLRPHHRNFNKRLVKAPKLYLLENVDDLTPVEIKSGQTLATDFFDGLKSWLSLSREPDHPAWLVYGGERESRSGNVAILPWSLVPGRAAGSP